MPDPRSREKAVADLHRFYGRKQLRLLVGNGVSIPSGFPPWDSLNLGLLEVLIRADSRDRNLWAGLIEPELPKLTRSLYDVLGRNGAADFVRMTSPRRFKRRLAEVLFSDVTLRPESLTDTQRQLAAMSSNAPLLTTNFDPLLEMAIADLKGSLKWERYRKTPRADVRAFTSGVVEHVHGFIEPDGGTGGHLILTSLMTMRNSRVSFETFSGGSRRPENHPVGSRNRPNGSNRRSVGSFVDRDWQTLDPGNSVA